MSTKTKLYLYTLISYIFSYKLFLIYQGEIINYIIHPAIIIIFALLAYIFISIDKYYKYSVMSSYEVIKMVLIYLILFYTIGLFIDYSYNPYSKGFNGLIINAFSVLLVVMLKEFIRNILLNNIYKQKIFHYFFITTIFIIFDLNFTLIKESFVDVDSFITIFIIYILPIISVNILSTYLCITNGFLPSLLYRSILSFIFLIVPIVPKYEDLYPALFDILFPLFTFLIIRYKITKYNKNNKYIENINPKNWITCFILVIIILLFNLGTFNIRPTVVLSGSMRPYIHEGDLLLIEKCNIEDIKEKDIIEFKKEDFSIVHRVINISKEKGIIKITTKGDNNIKEDEGFVTQENLNGCLKYRIKYIGYPSYLIRKIIWS